MVHLHSNVKCDQCPMLPQPNNLNCVMIFIILLVCSPIAGNINVLGHLTLAV